MPLAPHETAPSLRARILIGALGTGAAALVIYAIVGGLPASAHLNDFRSEAWPAYRALEHWHLVQFLRLSPAYVGSLVLRAPFLPLASLFGRGWRAAYAATALPCIVAPPVLGVWLSTRPGARIGRGPASRISPIVLCALNPVVVICIGFGHPEEVLGASLCVAAVVLATSGSARWAGLLVGLAVVNKSWALVAVPVVLAVLPAQRRQALAVVTLTVAAILGPILIARDAALSAHGAATSLGSQTTGIFLPPQLLFWFGAHSWVAREAHILLVIVGTACAGAWRWQRRRARVSPSDPSQALLLLALVLFLRCALDPWDNLYYQVPFLFAIMAYEAGRAPRMTMLLSLLLALAVPPHLFHASAGTHAALYAAVAIPTLLWLGASVYGLPRLRLGSRPEITAVATPPA